MEYIFFDCKTMSKFTDYLNADNVIHGRIYHKEKGWVHAKLNNYDEFIDAMVAVIGGRKKTELKRALKIVIDKRLYHYVFDRIIFKYGSWHYIPKQDENSELRLLRKYLYNLL